MMDQRRGKHVTTAGVALQAAFAVVVLIVWLWTHSLSAMAVEWLTVSGAALWLMAAFLFYCEELARREAMEIEEISAHGGAKGAIFEKADELQLRLAAKRVAFAHRWVSPIFTVLWAASQLTAALLVAKCLLAHRGEPLTDPAQGMMFLLVAGFAAFLFSFYCLGMSKVVQWRLLRATGSYLVINTIFLGGSAVSLLLAWQGYPGLDRAVAWAVVALQILLTVELLLNFVLDLYRPRIPGQEQRHSFDSRLLNLLAEPGKVGHSIAEAINYQFGFEVSKTWFYQLIGRAMVPMIIAGAAILIGFSAVVIVPDGQVCVVRHWGKMTGRQLEGGLHVTWPWPIDTVHRFDVANVNEFTVGTGTERNESEIRADFINGKEVYLWTKEHGRLRELDFIIAVPPRQERRRVGESQPPPPLNIIKLVASIQYNVSAENVYKYGYRFQDPEKMLECMANRELTRYFASATLDSPVDANGAARPEAVMTYGKQRAAEALKRILQADADRMGLGVEILLVNLLGVHPPTSAAAAYENVLKAQREQEKKRFQAEADAYRILTRQAGSPIAALKLDLAIRRYDQLEELNRLKNDPAARADNLRRFLVSAEDMSKTLGAEIQQEQLLGKSREGQLTDRQQLQAAYDDYLTLLRKVEDSAKGGSALDLAPAIRSAQESVEKLFAEATGEPAAMVARAEADRWEKEMQERARWEAFQKELLAYRASPRVYMLDRWLAVWDEALPEINKYVLAVDRDKVEIRLDWKREATPMEGVNFEGSNPSRGIVNGKPVR